MKLVIELYTILHLIILQFRVIFPYWIIGVIAGSIVSVFLSARINGIFLKIDRQGFSIIRIIFAALLGAASPICMYGTVPLIVSFGRNGFPQYLLASFMVSSILINPNLFIISFALSTPIAFIRLLTCVVGGIAAGILVRLYFKDRILFDFSGFDIKKKNDARTASLVVFLSDLNRCIVKTAPYFLSGILLTALFERYLTGEWISIMFGNNGGLGVVLAASFGIPVYVCGGGTIPLLMECLRDGMSIGSAVAFMISGPATKLTNLSAVKTILGIKNFTLYLAYSIAFAVIAGFLVDMVHALLY